MTKDDFIKMLIAQMSDGNFAAHLGGYVIRQDGEAEIDAGDGRTMRFNPGWFVVRPQPDGTVTLDDIEYQATPEGLKPPVDTDPGAQTGGLPFSMSGFFGRKKSARRGLPLSAFRAQALPTENSLVPVQNEAVDPKNDDPSFTGLVAREMASEGAQTIFASVIDTDPIVDDLKRRLAGLLPPSALAALDSSAIKRLATDLPRAPLTRDGVRRMMAQRMAESVTTFASGITSFDAIMAGHPATAAAWAQWKAVRADVSYSAQAKARTIEMRLGAAINGHPDLKAALDTAAHTISVSAQAFSEAAAAGDGVLGTLKAAGMEFEGFPDNLRDTIDEVSSFMKSNEEYSKTREIIEDMKAMIDEMFRKIQAAIANRFGGAAPGM